MPTTPSEEYFRELELRFQRLLDGLAGLLGPSELAEINFEVDHGEYGEALLVLAHIVRGRSTEIPPASREQLRSLAGLMGISAELRQSEEGSGPS